MQQINLLIIFIKHLQPIGIQVPQDVQRVYFLRFNACQAESKKPLHRETGFIRIQPGTNKVAFIIAQNSGLDPDD